MSEERRIGKRAEQKRRWDRENRMGGVCVDCGTFIMKKSIRCQPCWSQHTGWNGHMSPADAARLNIRRKYWEH